VAGFGEAMLDTLSDIWWPTNIPLTAYRAFGVHVPLYALLGYSLFLGFGSYLVFEFISDGRGDRFLWATAGVFFAADLLYEIPFLNLHLYRYYGPQPLRLAGFPLYWPVLNAMVVIAGGAMLYAVRDRLEGSGLFAGFAIPIVALGVLTGAAWPTFVTLHMSVGRPVRWAAALFTIGVSLWVVRAVAELAGSHEHLPTKGGVDAVIASAAP
jgi:hypothetical protein